MKTPTYGAPNGPDEIPAYRDRETDPVVQAAAARVRVHSIAEIDMLRTRVRHLEKTLLTIRNSLTAGEQRDDILIGFINGRLQK